MRSTTIVAVRRDGAIAVAGDGQVSVGNTVLKHGARKVRRIGDGVLVGFAGSAADGLTLFEKLEQKLDAFHGNLARAAVERPLEPAPKGAKGALDEEKRCFG